jgi:twitching motility protein PilT
MPGQPLSINEKVYECLCPDGVKRTLSLMDLLSQFKHEAFQRNGMSRVSDLHLKCGTAPHFRIDSEMIAWSERKEDRLDENQVWRLIGSLLNDEQQVRLSDRHEIDTSFTIPGLSFRVNVYRDRHGLAAALRVLPDSTPPIGEIGFPDDSVWQDIVTMKQGLVVVTGITGSGKSTTIASIIEHINETRRAHIITLEDPIEYVFENKRSVISQRQVGRDTTSFAEGLRAILREDPDIIMVGEIRDQETLTNALSAAETGHLVLTTLHTRDAKGVVTRMTDIFPSNRRDEVAAQISLALSWVVAQKLIPRPDDQGRVVAMEVLKNTPAVSSLIRMMNIPQIYSALQTGSRDQMCTLERSLVRLVNEGLVDAAEAEGWANLPEVFRDALRKP